MANKKINEEAKVIFYGENTRVSVIDDENPKARANAATDDRLRRHAMLQHVKAAHMQIKMSGEVFLLGWMNHGNSITYAQNSVAALCRDFARFPTLWRLKISARGNLYC